MTVAGSLWLWRVVFFVSTNDLLHEVVANYVLLSKLHDADSGDSSANFHGLDQA